MSSNLKKTIKSKEQNSCLEGLKTTKALFLSSFKIFFKSQVIDRKLYMHSLKKKTSFCHHLQTTTLYLAR